MIAHLVRLARPRDWAKSVFVLLPVPFAIRAGAVVHPVELALGVLGFCVISSGVYVMNDVRDAEADRAHPKKQRRPIASGAVPVGVAIPYGVALVASGFGLLLASGHPAVLPLAAIYLAVNVVYSGGGKHVPLLDVFLLASGFVIRVLVGCALVDASPSNWLLTVSGWVALFLGFAKRRADFSRGAGAEARSVKLGYTVGFLDQAMGIAAGVTLLSYTLYSQEAEVFVRGRELAGMPFVAFGLLHYLRLAHQGEVRDAPVEMAWGSRTLQLCGAGWLAATCWSLGLL